MKGGEEGTTTPLKPIRGQRNGGGKKSTKRPHGYYILAPTVFVINGQRRTADLATTSLLRGDDLSIMNPGARLRRRDLNAGRAEHDCVKTADLALGGMCAGVSMLVTSRCTKISQSGRNGGNCMKKGQRISNARVVEGQPLFAREG